MLKSDVRSLAFSNLAAAEKGRAALAVDKKVDPDSIRIKEGLLHSLNADPRPFWLLEWRLKR